MEFLADFRPTSIAPIPTTTISVDPPGGTHTHHHGGGGGGHLPLPTETFPTPDLHYIHSTHTGQTALWVIFALFTIGLIPVLFLTVRTEKRNRYFHGISALVLTIAMISYLAMSTGLGISYIPIHHHGVKGSLHHFARQLYWARYVDWLFTTPLLLLSLASLAGLSPASTLAVILSDVFMIITGLFSAVTPSRWASGERAAWGWFGISTFAFLLIWGILFINGLQAANKRPRSTKGLFTLLAAMTFILWCAYPIVFGLSEGANKISVDAEIIAYGVLDVAAKLGFTYLLLFLHTHEETGPWTLPDWWVESPEGHGPDGRGIYGSLGSRGDRD
ncbi:uncharacterized protein I303_106276 [Kwoniella dejecticola CBS 10117]|uniref:Opsin 1 n=1 Tax=Kwoniella dejecticola CBS 10117 TaxID=1296121 RepID=A0A1A6A1S0_9TREE|nr:uncharacterized protein I303_06295 [Kwoniella dejecticola CBS 10117]OBR84008.1 hypothetical protein I303_06295 [Kwoniella dejecticola CBS 10117]